MALSLQLGLVYLVSEVLLTITRRSQSKTGQKQDRSGLKRDEDRELRIEDYEGDLRVARQ
jgi:hypothetical protein